VQGNERSKTRFLPPSLSRLRSSATRRQSKYVILLFLHNLHELEKALPRWSGATLPPRATGRKMSHFEMNNGVCRGTEDSRTLMGMCACACACACVCVCVCVCIDSCVCVKLAFESINTPLLVISHGPLSPTLLQMLSRSLSLSRPQLISQPDVHMQMCERDSAARGVGRCIHE